MTNTQEKLEEILDNLGERYIMVEHRLIHQGMPESNGKHKELEHAKTKISHLIDSAKREGAIEELQMIPKEGYYGDEDTAVEYVKNRIAQLKQSEESI